MSQRLYTVDAVGSTDAIDIAKRRARDEGLRVRTVASVKAVDMPSKTERTRWVVALAIADRP